MALTVKNKELNEEELLEKFNQLWKKWVCDVSSDLPSVREPDIDTDSENILWEYFQKEINMVDILMRNSKDKVQINYDQHVKMKKKYKFRTQTLKICDRESINMTTEKMITRFNVTINNIHKKQCDYNTSYFHEILRLIEEEVKSAPTEDRYTFTSKYSIDLSLCLFQRAAKNFKEMHKAFCYARFMGPSETTMRRLDAIARELYYESDRTRDPSLTGAAVEKWDPEL